MGLIIPFPLERPAGAGLVAALDVAERTLLAGLRAWVAAFRRAEDPLPPLRAGFAAAGVAGAAGPVHALMAILARTARHIVEIRCPRCPHLSADEQRLLQAASLAQVGMGALAERVLRAAMLTAPGAEFALGPLQGVADIFAAAGLVFGRHLPPDEPPGGSSHPDAPPPVLH